MESNDKVTVHNFKWFANVHRAVKNHKVTNPKHVVDNATFDPATPSPSRATTEDAESPQSDQELEENLDNSCFDLNNYIDRKYRQQHTNSNQHTDIDVNE